MLKIIKSISVVLVLALILCFSNTVPVLAGPEAKISLSDSSAHVGDEITIEGFEFDDGEEITITIDGYDDEWDIDAENDGAWELDIEIPELPGGYQYITAQGDASSASKKIRILPQITLDSNKGKPGDIIEVSGTGFEADERDIVITFDGEIVEDNFDADKLGSWEAEFEVPSKSVGSYKVGAYGDDTKASAVSTVSFSMSAGTGISLNRTSGTVGTSINVTGTGFAAGETGIRVTYDGVTVGSAAAANSSGAWSLALTIPESSSGAHTISAFGSKTTSISDMVFNVFPSITLNPTSAPAGATINIKGTGFAANESGITVSYDGKSINTAVTANSKGSWTSTFLVPQSATGSHLIDAYGDETSASSTNNVNFVVGAGIILNKISGPPGTAVTVNGSGFAANEKGITVKFGDNTVVPGVTASPTGTWSAAFTIPDRSTGEYIVDAYGASTQSSTIPDITFTITPGITLSHTSGFSGAAVTVTGSGFTPNEKGISISFGDTVVSSGINVDATGKWTATFSVPPSPSGTQNIRINGTATDISAIGDFSFKVTAGIYLNPSSGTIGDTVNVSGYGFAPISTLKFYFDDNEIPVGRVTADATGSFEKKITIPPSKSGTYVLKVIDAQNNAGNSDFNIDSTPPTVPNPITPLKGAAIGLFGGASPTLSWSGSTASSDVTYTIQIDASHDFTSLILEKTGLTSTKYTLSDTESLPRGGYYWRVRAVDAASNHSEWSEAALFKSGVMPPFVFALILILVLAGIGAALYFYGLPWWQKRRALAVTAGSPAPEIIIPQVVNAEYRMLEAEDASRKKGKALPWRLALPQAPQAAVNSKQLSTEDQARLKSIVDFVSSVPLVEPGNDTSWLVELAESSSSNSAGPFLYTQILKGDVELRYEPSWMRHPTFVDLQALLEGQPLLQDLNSFVDSVNHAATDSVTVLQDIYHSVVTNTPVDVLENGGWDFISGVYSDAIGWFQCKYLREPSDKDYIIKADAETGSVVLHGAPNTPFAGPLIQAPDEAEASQLRSMHLQLRRRYRDNSQVRDMVTLITQLEVQRGRLIKTFSHFNQLNA